MLVTLVPYEMSLGCELFQTVTEVAEYSAHDAMAPQQLKFIDYTPNPRDPTSFAPLTSYEVSVYYNGRQYLDAPGRSRDVGRSIRAGGLGKKYFVWWQAEVRLPGTNLVNWFGFHAWAIWRERDKRGAPAEHDSRWWKDTKETPPA